MKALWLLLALLLLTLAPADADKRQRGDERRGFPFSSEEHWDGDRRWTPDRRTRRQWPWPDRFTVDKPGKCEVRCVRFLRTFPPPETPFGAFRPSRRVDSLPI